jgi:hypothetical protein
VRVDLNSAEGSPLVVATPEEFREFYSYEDARSWLTAFAHDPLNLDEMRRALTEQLGHGVICSLTNHEVLDLTAREIMKGCVAYVGQALPPTLSPPKGAPKPFPTLSLAALADLIKELPRIPLDLIPDAIVPPEFPRMAAVEVGALDLETKKMQFRMDLLRYVGSATPDESGVGTALADAAIRLGASTRQAVEDAGGGLESLASAADLAGPVSDLAKALGVSNDKLVGALVAASEGNNTAISDILAGSPLSDIERTAIGAVLADTGSSVATLSKLSGQTGDDLAKMLKESPAAESAESAIGASMGDTEASQNALIKSAGGAAALLAGLTQRVAAGELKASQVSAAFDGISTEQVEALAGLTGGMGDGMAAVAAMATLRGADPSELGAFFERMSGSQGDRLGELSGDVGRDLSGLLGTGPELGGIEKPSLDLSAPDVDPGFAWVRFQVVDDTTGAPVGGVLIRIRAGDEVHELVTGRDGTVEADNIPEGPFDIERVEDKLSREVVSMEGKPPPGGAADPAPGGGNSSGGGTIMDEAPEDDFGYEEDED